MSGTLERSYQDFVTGDSSACHQHRIDAFEINNVSCMLAMS